MIRGIPFVRGGVSRSKLNKAYADDVVVEFVGRTAENRTFGWSATLGKYLHPNHRLKANLIYSDIPTALYQDGKDQIMLNYDMILLGKRMGLYVKYAVTKNLEMSWFAAHRLDATPTTRNRAQMALIYRFSDLVNPFIKFR